MKVFYILIFKNIYAMKKLNKFELARIIGARAAQIAQGAFILIREIPSLDPIEIAEKELEEGRIPFNIIYIKN